MSMDLVPQKTTPRYLRRDHERYPVNTHALLILSDNTKNKIQLEDVSAGGLRGVAPCQFKIDDQVKVILRDPFFEDFVKRDAKVVWCRQINIYSSEVGLYFGYDKLDLKRYVTLNCARNAMV